MRDIVCGDSKGEHPAIFSDKVVERLIRIFSSKKDTVLDPFNGIGTTTEIANKLNREYIGIDISEEYCRVARERLVRQQVLV